MLEVASFPTEDGQLFSTDGAAPVHVEVARAAVPSLRIKRKIDQMFARQDAFDEQLLSESHRYKGGADFLAEAGVHRELRLAASTVPYPTVADLVYRAMKARQAATAEIAAAVRSSPL